VNKYTIEFINTEFKKEGYEVLSTSYKNKRQKLDYICPSGHTHKISWAAWRSGCRCRFCNFDNRRNKIEFIRSEFEKAGYILLTEIYISARAKLKYICPAGHNGEIAWYSWKAGSRCVACCGHLKLTLEFLKEEFAKDGYILLTEVYKNNVQKLKFVCPNGHVSSISYANWNKGKRCGKCSKRISKPELEIIKFIKENFNQDVIEAKRKVIAPLELDIYIPANKLAIEYCGLYWHSELMGKDKQYHLNKLERCNEKGIKLITIFEDEWINKKDIIKSILRDELYIKDNFESIENNVIIKEVSNEDCKEFLNKNHICGYSKSETNIGLYIKEELHTILSFNRIHAYEYNVVRLCNKIFMDEEYNLLKLFKYFMRHYKPHTVITYTDRRWPINNILTQIGFKQKEILPPKYFYLYSGKPHIRFRKKDIKKLSKDSMNLLNTRIWDCGNVKWVWERK